MTEKVTTIKSTYKHGVMKFSHYCIDQIKVAKTKENICGSQPVCCT